MFLKCAMFKCAMRFFARSLAIVCLLAGFAILQAVPVAAQTLGFSKAFSPATVETGGTSTLTYKIDNTANAIEVGSLAFMDFLPAGVTVASSGPAVGCGEAISVQTRNSFGTGRVTFSGGTVAAGGTCTISVDVVSSLTGTLTGTSRDLTSDLPVATPGASATLTVVPPGTPIEPETLVFSKAYSPATVEVGRDLDVDLHDRQYGQRHRGGFARLYGLPPREGERAPECVVVGLRNAIRANEESIRYRQCDVFRGNRCGRRDLHDFP